MDNNNEQNQSTYVQNDTGTTINTGTVLNEEKKDKKGFSIAALVLGIIAIVLSCVWYVSVPAGIVAIILGIIGINSSKKGLSVAGIVTGVIGIILTILLIVAVIALGIAALGSFGSELYNNLDDFQNTLNENIEDYGEDFEDQLNKTLDDYKDNFEINYSTNMDII